MKRKVTIERIQPGEGATIYSFKLDSEEETEYLKYWNKYEPITEEKISWSFDIIDGWIEKFLEHGSFEDELKRVDRNTKGLPINVGSQLRLYCYRIGSGILIIGNGGEKPQNPDPQKNKIRNFPKLEYYSKVVKAVGEEIEKQLKEPIKNGKIGRINNELIRLNPIFIDLPDEP